MIRGLNQELTIAAMKEKLKEMFSERLPKKDIIEVHVIREDKGKYGSATEIVEQIKRCRERLEEARFSNGTDFNVNGIRLKKKASRRWIKFVKKSTDAEDYYSAKMVELKNKWYLKKKALSQKNAGIAFVTFKDKAAANEAIDEIEGLKLSLEVQDQWDQIGFSKWEVEKALPVSDIIWSNLGKSKNENWIKSFLAKIFLPFIITTLVIMSLLS